MSAPDLNRKLLTFFEGRTDAFAQQNNNGSYCPVREPLTEEYIQAHLDGKNTIGIYLFKPGEDVVNFCALDIDNKDNTLIYRSIAALRKAGIDNNQILLEDSGNKGRHIFLRFASPIKARNARVLLEIILKLAEIELPIEIFPKQDRVKEDGFGNLIKLPLGLHRVSGNRSFFMNVEALEPLPPDQFPVIEFVTPDQVDDILNEFGYLFPTKSTEPALSEPPTTTDEYPCIKSILNGVSEGVREISLFNLCVYFLKIKRIKPEVTKPLLIAWNLKNKPPLTEEEIEDKIIHVIDGEYNRIACTEPAIKRLCSTACPLKAKKEAREEQKKKQTGFLINDNHIVELIYSEGKGSSFVVFDRDHGSISLRKEYVNNGQTYIPCFDDIITSNAILLPSGAEDYPDEITLINQIRNIIHKYIELDPCHEDLCAYYVLFTYLSDCFDTLPYLRFKGDYGTGKSRAITVVGSMCYKATICGGATTPSPIFRMIDKYSGTMILDEADFPKSDASEEIIKILNTGYMKGVAVLRSEKSKDFETKAYKCYSPKILASRFVWIDKALESRCITVEMKGKTRNDIPFNITLADFYRETLGIRNKLLMFRLKNYGKHTIDENSADYALEARLNQIMLPLLAIIRDEQTKENLRQIMRQLNKRLIQDRGMTLECDVLKIIIRKIINEKKSIRLKEIADDLNLDNENYYDKKISPKKIGLIVENLNLLKEKKVDGFYVVIPDEKQLAQLKKKFDLE